MLIGYLAVANLVTFILMGADKTKARHGKHRIPEKVLFLFSVIGGSVGAIVGMFVFRHKTKHLCFVLGLPAILLLQLIALLMLI